MICRILTHLANSVNMCPGDFTSASILTAITKPPNCLINKNNVIVQASCNKQCDINVYAAISYVYRTL